MNRLILLCSVVLLVFSSCTSTGTTEVISPDGRIKLTFAADAANGMTYRVQVGDTALILPSSLGFEARNGVNLSRGFHVVNTNFDKKNETWTQPWGENKQLTNNYQEMAVNLEDSIGTRLTLRFRLFNDGLGFRYEYQVPAVDSVLVTNELTAFNLADNGTSWSIPANFETYELLYRTLPIDSVQTANTPITFKTTSGIYASIHEAALTDFPEMTLKKTGNCAFGSELAPWPDGVKARFAGGQFTTPWRTIQIGNKAVDLINSSLILNLNEPCALETTDWIRPMKYVGIWWGMHLGVES